MALSSSNSVKKNISHLVADDLGHNAGAVDRWVAVDGARDALALAQHLQEVGSQVEDGKE